MNSRGDDQGSLRAGNDGSFPNTRWSLILRAGDDESVVAQDAIAEICQLYHYPIYVFALRTGCRPQDTMDLTQGFFEFFLRTEAYTKADPSRGKLRSFLRTSFKNFVSTERRKQQAAKRGATRRFSH